MFHCYQNRASHEVTSRGSASLNGATPTDTPTTGTSGVGGPQVKMSAFSDDHLLRGEGERATLSSSPMVYTWGGCTSLPIKLDPPIKETNEELVGVACGRNQRAGVTKDGKLFFWRVSW